MRTRNVTTKTFTVTVRDTTAPVIANVPANITLEATGPAGAAVTYAAATATDAVGPITITYSAELGLHLRHRHDDGDDHGDRRRR